MADLVETPFSDDGPLTDPWSTALGLGYAGDVPVATGGVVTGLAGVASAAVTRPDRAGVSIAGIRAASDFSAASMAAAGVVLALAVSDVEWYELSFAWSGSTWSVNGYRVTGSGAVYDEIIPTTDVPAIAYGAAVALQIDGTTMRALLSASGDTTALESVASGSLDPTLAGDLIPGFVVLSDVGVAEFFSGTSYAVVAATGLLAIAEAMAAKLAPLAASVPGLQVTAFLNPNPTPPSIDIYPADLFQTGLGFGDDRDTYWTVRARTTTADHESGQRALLALLDRSNGASVEGALTADQTLGGVAQSLAIAEEGVSGYRVYLEDPQGNGSLIGCEWRVEVITK